MKTNQQGTFDKPTGLVRFLVILALFFGASNSRALDVIHLQNEQVIQCKIEAITDNIVTYITEIKLSSGQTGVAKRTIPTAQIKFIDYGPIAGETELLENLKTATVEEIDAVWDKKYAHLHRPKNNAGTIGIALGNALLREESEFKWRRALELFDHIHERAWDEPSKNEARQGRLRSLIRMGDLETAIHEARQLASETEDPTMLIEARYIVARADFERLKKLEDENPKWEEDDTVLPERNRLYHATVDEFLWPYLFHGTKEEQAARGLVAAGEVYRFAEKEDDAAACFEDAMKLYPETEAAKSAQQFLENSNKPTPTNDTNETKNP